MKILFICVLGASTSLIAQRVKDAARDQGLDLEVSVIASHEVSTKDLSVYDCIVLGPQVSYLKGPLREQVSDKVNIVVIPGKEYGLGDGGRILNLILTSGN